jgi:hypothetical protein
LGLSVEIYGRRLNLKGFFLRNMLRKYWERLLFLEGCQVGKVWGLKGVVYEDFCLGDFWGCEMLFWVHIWGIRLNT